MRTEAIVWDASSPLLVERTRRALRDVDLVLAADDASLVARLTRSDRGALLVRAGAWPLGDLRVPPPSATGKPLLALGAGGHSLFVERPRDLARAIEREGDLERAVRALSESSRVRAVRVHALDADWSGNIRAVVAVTTLHRGGAERVVLDLVAGLRARGHAIVLAVLDRPSRATFAAPEGTVFLHERASGRAARIDALLELARAHAADAIHAHLLDGDEIARLAKGEVPVVVTAHNAPEGWPARLIEGSRDAALVVGCSRDVSRALEDAGIAAPVRTIWNGVSPGRGPRTPSPGDALVLLAVANHRPQKRLERLPAIVAELRDRGVASELVLVGEPVKSDDTATRIAAAVEAEAARLGVRDAVRFAGSSPDVRPLYRSADVVVSASAFEGLSLVHLEALAEGTPLVSTRVSGATEIAAKHPHARVVDLDAPPSELADAVLEACGATGALAPDFEVARAVDRHEDLLVRAALRRPRRSRDGLVLVTNNFATGGAQSSARRLLAALARAGVRVSAVVVEEQPSYPTPGRTALEAAGIPVFAAPRAGRFDPLVTARAVAAHVDALAPEAVLFWNVIPEHKVLIADLLLDVPVWDVSPGEMYFASFERYFARPRTGSPVLDLADYRRLLAGTIVKYAGEHAHGVVIPNGVDVPASPPVRPPRARVVAGTLARISPDKKLEQLVDAMRSAPGVELRIAGGVERGCEDYLAMLRARAEGLPVAFAGEQDASAFLASIDLFAMVSEPCGCPNASLEAMAAGLAVVATDAGGARDQIVHGETGLLVARGDARALGLAIAELARDPARRAAMGRAAHARAASLFTVERMAADYARVCLGRSLAASTPAAAE